MRTEFVQREAGPERLVSEAELHFDETDGPLEGMKLVGFCLWRGADDELRVTMPACSFGIGSDRRYFDLFRVTDGNPATMKALKAWILEAYKAWILEAYKNIR